jgi:hypothetical protein
MKVKVKVENCHFCNAFTFLKKKICGNLRHLREKIRFISSLQVNI